MDANSQSQEKMTWGLIIVLGFIAALTPLAIDMYLPAMPLMSERLATTPDVVQQTLTVFSIGFALGQLFVGPISDSTGRRIVMLAGTLLFTVSSWICAQVTTIDDLIFWRAIQGVAGASSGVMISAIVKDMFGRDDFSKMMSFIVLVMTLAPLVAPLLGGYITLYFGWRAIFWVLAGLGIVSIILVVWRIPETLPPSSRQSFAIGRSVRQYIKIIKDPMSLSLMFSGAFSFACLFSFLVSAAFVYMDVYGIAVDYVGYLFACNVMALMVLTTVNGRYVGRKGAPHMLRWGLQIQFVGGVLLVPSLFGIGGVAAVVVPCMIIIGATTMVGSNLMAKMLERHQKIAGTASSLVGSFRFGVGSLVGASSTMLPFSVQTNMVATIVCSAAASMVAYRYHRYLRRKLGNPPVSY